jgi:beta-glucanase (GH16 family)
MHGRKSSRVLDWEYIGGEASDVKLICMAFAPRTRWTEEFDGAAGEPPDPAVWVLQSGGSGDQQVQEYTTSTANVSQTGHGCLQITALRDGAGRITSAQLITKDRLTFRYGRVEARIKVPAGPGVWPAFWMLGSDIDRVGWPACGEIDVMEYVGSDPRRVHGTLHGPGYSGLEAGIGRALDTGSELSADFHRFAVEWRPDLIEWYIDDEPYQRLLPSTVPGAWPFRHDFYLLLNLAVGGAWPGLTVEGIAFPATMLIDWVRINPLEPIVTG